MLACALARYSTAARLHCTATITLFVPASTARLKPLDSEPRSTTAIASARRGSNVLWNTRRGIDSVWPIASDSRFQVSQDSRPAPAAQSAASRDQASSNQRLHSRILGSPRSTVTPCAAFGQRLVSIHNVSSRRCASKTVKALGTGDGDPPPGSGARCGRAPSSRRVSAPSGARSSANTWRPLRASRHA